MCYSSKNDFNYIESVQCEEYHYKNDWKLNALGTFVTDHSVRMIRDYKACIDNVAPLKTNEAKDRSFLECHNRWVKEVQGNITEELERRA